MTTSEVKELDREQIMAMEAGPEIDALVAVLRMGWRDIETGCWYDDQNGIAHEKSVYHDGSPISSDMFAPSFYIAAAWEVVEKLNWDITTLCRCPNAQKHIQWWCANTTDAGVGAIKTEITAFAPTAPLAICRAALLTTITD